MKIYQEYDLCDFDFWGGAKDTISILTVEELEYIQSFLEEILPSGCDATTLNDFFWFDTDYIADILGYDDFEQMWQDRR